MKKLCLILALTFVFILTLAISVSGAELVDGIYYTFEGTEATVANNNQKNCSLENVVIPEKVTFNGTEYTVTKIAEKAFGSGNKNGGNANVKTVVVPSTVTSVGEYGFGNCPNIEEVYCKSQKIGSRMFIDCAKLDTLTLENTVEIGGNAFNRTAITSVFIPSTVTTVGDYAFKECASLTKVVILGEIMGKYMFYGCSSLNTLVLTEKFVTFGTSCLGNATNNAFITYYTGTDYDRIKTLCSSTSRFSKAKCYSYSDYVQNGYTDTYKLIYDVNLCVAAFGGVHTEPSDDGNCETEVMCSVCNEYTYKEAKEHNITESIIYSNFAKNGEYSVKCTNDGCKYGTSQTAYALFNCVGLSTPVSENRGEMVIGYTVNFEAIELYEKVMNITLDYGIFAVAKNKIEDNDIFENGEATNGVVTATVDRTYVAFEFRIAGFETEEHKNAKIALGAYVIDSKGNSSYIQIGTPNENEKYVFVSFNDISKIETE